MGEKRFVQPIGRGGLRWGFGEVREHGDDRIAVPAEAGQDPGMRHVLRRHPFPVDAAFDFVVAGTFAVDPEVVQEWVYPGVELDLYDGRAFVAIAMVQTRRMRPGGFPSALGLDFFLVGYRIFVRCRRPDGRLVRGLQVLRSDVDSAFLCTTGNWMTHYGYSRAKVRVEGPRDTMRIDVAGDNPWSELCISIDRKRAVLPPKSVFPDLRTARRFAGPMPFTFSYEKETGKLVSIEGRRAHWHPKTIEMKLHRSAFLDFLKSRGRVEHAAAFWVDSVDYRWGSGVVFAPANSGNAPPNFRPFPDAGQRPALDGTARIIRFNWPLYATATLASGVGIAMATRPRNPGVVRMGGAFLGLGVLSQALISLLASHSVYDRSMLRNTQWLADRLRDTRQVVVIHSGFDPVTSDLRHRLRETEITSVDLFDPGLMTEASIRRARNELPPPADVIHGHPERLPLPGRQSDAVLLIFSAHELRSRATRLELFREIHRILRPGGMLLLVEHPRDLANFLAFGVGFLHFLPARAWRDEPSTVLSLQSEERLHPLVRAFQFQRDPEG